MITVVDPLQDAAPESGVPAADLIAFADKDGKKLLTDLGARSATQLPPLALVPLGTPATEIEKAWSRSISVSFAFTIQLGYIRVDTDRRPA